MDYRQILERLHREHVRTIRWVRRRPTMSQNDREPTIMAELVAKELREIFESITRFGIHSVETLEEFPDALLFLFQSRPQSCAMQLSIMPSNFWTHKKSL